MDFTTIKPWKKVLLFLQVLIPVALQQTTSCQRCTQTPTDCREIRGTFGVTVMSRGYNPVINIPAGACSINITERGPSSNFLAVKTTQGKYIINGLWTIDPTGEHEGAGTIFTYGRTDVQCPGECIRAEGPISENLIVQVLYHHTNPGIDYSYSLPPNIDGAGSRIEEHHRQHHHRHDKHTLPLDSTEQRKIEALKRGEPISAYDVTNSTSAPPSQASRTSHRRRPIFSSDFRHGRTSFYRRRHPEYIPPYERRQSLTDVTSNRRRQSLTDATYSQAIPPDDRYGQERPSYTSASESPSNRIDRPLPPSNRKDTVSLPDSSEYSWRISGFTECSRSCGGGIQETVIVCMLTIPQVTVTEDSCDPNTKPTAIQLNCNTNPCTPDWETDEWSPCSVTCGQGQRTRRVVCKQRISATLMISVSADECSGRKPAMVANCQGEPCSSWNVGTWSQCSVDCGEGVRRREVICQDAAGGHLEDDLCEPPQPRTEEPCDMGSCTRHWFFTRWQDQCSADCGAGVMSRQIHCADDSGEVQPEDQCDVTKRPRDERRCRSAVPCGGKWFSGPWSQCSVSCGVGVRTRDVGCMKRVAEQLLSVGTENCQPSERPADSEPCDLHECGTQWYMTDWAQCSVSCGGGVMRRYVRCLNGEMTPSNLCPDSERPADAMRCNTERCWGHSPSPGTTCRDMFPNCRVVVQARLCRYSYYQMKCCRSCSS